MPIFLNEDNKELNKERYTLSKKGQENLNAAITKMEAMGLQNHDGYKMLKHLQDDEYNPEKDKDEKVVKDPNIHTQKDKLSITQTGIPNKTVEGGIHNNKKSHDKVTHAFTDWVYGTNGELSTKHKVKQNLDAHKAQTPKVKEPTKIEPMKQEKPIKLPKGDVHIMKEYISPNDNWMTIEKNPNFDWEDFDERVYEYDYAYILDCFKENKNPWLPLINPAEYQQALNYYSKGLEIPPILSKKIYQWIGIVMKNIKILNVCTELCGHEQYFPSDDIIDLLLGDSSDEEMKQQYAEEHGLDLDDDDIASDLLDRIGFYDWEYCRISDYGLQPLYQILSHYNDNLSPEETLVLLNKILDVTHMRDDLSELFMNGGAKALTKISGSGYINENIKRKKIIILQEQIDVLSNSLKSKKIL